MCSALTPRGADDLTCHTCWAQVGLALGMPEPGPACLDELTRHLFTHPTDPSQTISGKVSWSWSWSPSNALPDQGETESFPAPPSLPPVLLRSLSFCVS